MVNYNKRKYLAWDKAVLALTLMESEAYDELKQYSEEYETAYQNYIDAGLGTLKPRDDAEPPLEQPEAIAVMAIEAKGLDLLEEYGFKTKKNAGAGEYSQAEFVWFHLFTPSGVTGPGGGSRAW